MIRLRVLGSTDLRGPDGQALRSILAQPKRLTLLSYLVLNPAAGFARRDKLVALFWPNSGPDKARASLRSSLSYLRKALGEGVVVTRGDEEVGIAPGTFECDAVAFEEALEMGAPGPAMELYGGPLLDGVFVSDAPELERWLENRRNELERRAFQAATTLAEQSEAQGDLQTALAWTRRALSVEPHNERGICQLIALLDATGDREGAVRTYDQFAEWMARELDLLPSDETRALVVAIRSAPVQEAPVIEVVSGTIDHPRSTAVQPVRTRTATESRRRYPRLLSAATVTAAAFIVVLALWGSLRPAPTEPVVRYSMTFAEGEEMTTRAGRRFALSPDGSRLLYTTGPQGLFLRRRDRLHASRLPDTERALSPFFSPDGEWAGFISRGQLQLVSLDGGAIVVVTDEIDPWGGVTWGPDGFLYARQVGFGGLVRMPPEPGATPRPFTQLDPQTGESDHHWPDVLPNGKGILLTVTRAGLARSEKLIAVADLRTGAHKVLMEGIYAKHAGSDHLLYVTPDSTLMVVDFDPDALEVTGVPRVVSQQQRVGFRGSVDVAVSETGTLVYAIGQGWLNRELVWVGRDGAAEPVDATWQGNLMFPTLSPDGSRVAVTLPGDDGGVDIWIRDLDTGVGLMLTVEGGVNGYPSWTPDGRAVTYFSDTSESVELWTKAADGSGNRELVLSRDRDLAESHWSPNGEWLIYRTTNVPQPSLTRAGGTLSGASDIMAIRPGVDEEPIPVATTDHAELCPALSPDGRWLAYASEETGREEVFVVPFPNVDEARWSVSPNGGTEPVWSRASGELFYRDLQGTMWAVQVKTTPPFELGPATPLFDAQGYVVSGLHQNYAVAPDGHRFLMVREVGERDPGELIVVENWFQELRTPPVVD